MPNSTDQSTWKRNRVFKIIGVCNGAGELIRFRTKEAADRALADHLANRTVRVNTRDVAHVARTFQLWKKGERT